jgi:hypothetical protein
MEVVYSCTDYEISKITDIKEFLKTVKIWKGLRTRDGKYSVDNREVDENKVNEIYKCILNNTLTPSSLYISEVYDNKDKDFVLRCWEGQHRWYALKKYYLERHNRNINNLFFCIVYRNDTDDNIRIKFRNFNKITPVPIDESEDIGAKINRIELTKGLVDYIKDLYPNLQSTSINPRRPNYNIDNLNRILNDFIKDNNLENMNLKFFQSKIVTHNLKLKEFYTKEYETKIKPTYIKKAFEHNCFLFLLDDFTTSMDVNEENKTFFDV